MDGLHGSSSSAPQPYLATRCIWSCVQELVACYVYSTWINSGAIQCAESGSHNRPNRHAELAKEMVR